MFLLVQRKVSKKSNNALAGFSGLDKDIPSLLKQEIDVYSEEKFWDFIHSDTIFVGQLEATFFRQCRL